MEWLCSYNCRDFCQHEQQEEGGGRDYHYELCLHACLLLTMTLHVYVHVHVHVFVCIHVLCTHRYTCLYKGVGDDSPSRHVQYTEYPRVGLWKTANRNRVATKFLQEGLTYYGRFGSAIPQWYVEQAIYSTYCQLQPFLLELWLSLSLLHTCIRQLHDWNCSGLALCTTSAYAIVCC